MSVTHICILMALHSHHGKCTKSVNVCVHLLGLASVMLSGLGGRKCKLFLSVVPFNFSLLLMVVLSLMGTDNH